MRLGTVIIGREINMRTFIISIVILTMVLTAGIAMAKSPANFGGKGKAWESKEIAPGINYYEHKKDSQKNWDAKGGKRFTIPGKSEGKANNRSVIGDTDHGGTQVRPGSNR